MQRNIARKIRMKDETSHEDLKGKTPGELMAMVFELRQNAWAFLGVDIARTRLQRNVVHIVRPAR